MEVIRHSLIVSGLIAVLAFALAPGSADAAGWLPEVDVAGAGSTPTAPQVGLDGSGNAIAVWNAGASGACTGICAATRVAGGAWNTPVQVTSSAANPQLSVDSGGNALAAWAAGGNILASYKPAGGAWQSAVTVATGTTALGDVEVDPSAAGRFALVWSASGTVYFNLDSSGSLGAIPQQVDSGLSAVYNPTVAVDSNGHPMVVYAYLSGANYGVRAALRPASTWSPTDMITQSTTSTNDTTGVGFDANGNATITWDQGNVVWARQWVAGVWKNAAQLSSTSNAGYSATGPRVSVEPTGSAAVVWTYTDNSMSPDHKVQSGTFDTSNFHYTYDVGDPTYLDYDHPQLTHAGGGTLALYRVHDYVASNYQVRSAPHGVNDYAFGTVKTAGTSNSQPNLPVAVAGDPAGNATAVWTVGSALATAVYDAVAPSQSSVSVPATAVAGSSTTFSLTSSDRWGPITTHWNFGDGTTASGDSVTHAYANAGTYTVVAESTDAAGNSTGSTPSTITVSGAGGSTWSTPSALAPTPTPNTDYYDHMNVAAGLPGQATVAFDQDSDSCGPVGTDDTGAWVASHSPGGGWDPAQNLSATGCSPVAAYDGQGNGYVAWFDANLPEHVDFATRAPSAASWSPDGSTPIAGADGITSNLTSGLPSIALVVDATGDAVAAWEDATFSSGTYYIEVATHPAGGAWSAAQAIATTTTSTFGQPQLAIDSQGRVTAVWPDGAGLSFAKRENGAWTAPAAIGGSANQTGFALALDAQGNATVIWTLNTNEIDSSDSAAGNANGFSAPTVALPASGTSVSSPALGIDGPAMAVAAWDSGSDIVTARRPAGGSAWDAPQTITAPNSAGAISVGPPALEVARNGDTFVSWDERMNIFGTQTTVLEVARRPAGAASSGAAAALSSSDGNGKSPPTPRLAFDSAGDSPTAWFQDAIPSAGVLDVNPPVLSNESAPTDAAVSAPVSASIAASDAWGAPSVSWDFGDGTTASGSSASHTYSAPGNYSLRVIATDGAGNSTSATRTIAIAAPPSSTTTGSVGAAPSASPPLPPPVAGQTANLARVSGTVLVKVAGAKQFVPLTSPTQIRNGSIVDARHGRVRITIDNGRGHLDTADFYGGIFKFEQPKAKAGRLWFADLFLFGGRFKGCPPAPRHPQLASAAAKRSHRSVRQLWGSGHGAFRTVGRFSSASIRGTTWLTDDRCDGTLTQVTAGKVAVRDFVRKKTLIVTAKHKYFAKAR